MQNIILILLSVLIVIVIFIIYIGYKKVSSFEIRLQKLQLDLISLQNLFSQPRPRVTINESHNQLREFSNDMLDDNLNDQNNDQDSDEDSDENSDEYTDDSGSESDENTDEDSDVESENATDNIEDNNNNVDDHIVNVIDGETDNSVLDINTDMSDQEKEVLFQNVKQVDEILVNTSSENDINNITNVNLDEMLATPSESVSDTKVVNVVKKKTRKVPNQKPSDLEVGTERVSENNGKNYVVMQNKNGINRWALVK